MMEAASSPSGRRTTSTRSTGASWTTRRASRASGSASTRPTTTGTTRSQLQAARDDDLAKLHDKEAELERLEAEYGKVNGEIDKQESAMAELGGTKFMTRDEYKKFVSQLREKTHVYKKLKGELGDLRAESVTLHRTEQILRGRVANLEVFLTELEARRGVRGYRDTQDKLERASEQTAEADAMKEKTLEEISNMVRSINQQLKEKKSDLAPQIKKLREVRNQYQLVETDFLQKKTNYYKVAVGLDVERQQLEHECDTQ